MKKTLWMFCMLITLWACKETTIKESNPFVRVKDGQFVINDEPYYFVGTNFWYGSILGSEGQGGNRERLGKELDFMKSIGITNLRVLVGADGYPGRADRVMPTLQLEPGVYNDTIFHGLDYFMAEVAKRDMYAVLYLNNSWEWSGGYAQYLNWTGKGDAPEEGAHDWNKYQAYLAQYADCEECHELFFNHIKQVLGRTNTYTGKKYIDDPAIMAWQIGNEPRPFSPDVKASFADWLKRSAALIRELDANHLISVGSEGIIGSSADMTLYETIHADPNIDYLTIHIWPSNWNWIDKTDVTGSIDMANEKTDTYIDEHLLIAERLNKPVTIEEFGYPRDNHLYTLDDPVTARDAYYENIFTHYKKSVAEGGLLAGINFWAWGGFDRPTHEFWQPGDDYLGDPSQEEQGLFSVFDTDSTIDLIRRYKEQ